MKKIIKIVRILSIILFVILFFCFIYAGLAIYVLNKDTFGTEAYSKTNLNYINGRSDYTFKMSEIDLIVTTSKREEAQFYVVFSKDSTQLSYSVDYLKYKTGDMSEVNLVFDPRNKNNIYIRETEYLKEIHPVNYDLQVLRKSEFFSRFFEHHTIKKDSLILKYPFIFVGMFTSSYGIYMKKHEEIFRWIKKGDIYGGW